MKKNIIISCIILVISVLLNADVLFKLDDPLGDDYGNGSVIYPENPMFDEPIFDLISFEFSEKEENYIFNFTFAARINPVKHAEFQFSYDLPDDFILPLIHIYIDKDHMKNSGFTETVFGTNILLEEESGWEKAVIIASMPQRYSGELERLQPELYRNITVLGPLLSKDEKTISARVAKRNLGEINEDWGFAVLVMSQDFSQTIRKNIYIREVNSTASQFNFGGGHSSILKDFDPNVIDLLVPPGSDQKRVLNSYDQENKKLAELQAVYPYTSSLISNKAVGEVKQVSSDKVVINLGSENGVEVGSQLIINHKIVVIAEDVFAQLTIASLKAGSSHLEITEGMKVTLLNK
ncbi:MAG: hypothetical protein APR54_00690 [Candidatus Cloacimonas sp. SDB]|nr:MAG: hypothetical protein APR54_00690 [Candidatus Cloacimonas sp. SDB]